MKVFGTRLHTARVISGLSLQGLSDAIGNIVSKQSMSMYESGLMEPRRRTLNAIADALGVSVNYFYKGIDEIDVPQLRTSIPNAISQDEMSELESSILFLADRIDNKQRLLNMRQEFSCSLRHLPISGTESATVLADRLREEWTCGDGPVPSMLRLLERHGIWVFDLVLPDGVLGVSTWVEGNCPLIVLDTREEKTTVERLRFTAAHELAHLLFKVPEGLDPERMCNLFASYFLLPKNTLIQELGTKRDSIYLEELIDLRQYYGVSVAAIVHEAYDFGIISREHYDYWYDTLIKHNVKEAGWGTYVFPETLGKERRMEVRIEKGDK